MNKLIGLKIDVDTERGTRIGVKNLLQLFARHNIYATFLFSLGPDNTGRALKRIFRPGFLKKVSRTSVVSTYGIKTLLNGVLWPGPHIAKKHPDLLQQVQKAGHEVGIHCYDHCRWQDYLFTWSEAETKTEFNRAVDCFKTVFHQAPQSAGTPGWQANAASLQAYDDAHLLYGSDCRGPYPFYPKINGHTFKTLQIPSNLPTLDELLGRPEYPLNKITETLLERCELSAGAEIFTLHAELEGMRYLEWFEQFITQAQGRGFQFVPVEALAKKALEDKSKIPVCEMVQGEVEGRSGTLAIQQCSV
ncbi:MAG: 4-deoxy-4-formamido-L-arabinose-phosphoundecaprenol deformylase [Gammaproteobacteria bacterium]|nr:4-deoxy-4-formamido-L-arabinose-phosphoundecaprenol deformylase [Gammaproteobacteria bacterium]